MRLFAALRPLAEAVEHAEGAVAPLLAAFPELRWVPSERWHLTLAFYGEVPDSDVDRLARRVVRTTAGAPAMSLRLAGAGRFPKRAVWLGVDGDTEALTAVARRLATDDRPYRPHLTVARLRGDPDPSAAVAALAAYAGPSWPATEVALVRSHLGPSPGYEDVMSSPFRPAFPADRD